MHLRYPPRTPHPTSLQPRQATAAQAGTIETTDAVDSPQSALWGGGGGWREGCRAGAATEGGGNHQEASVAAKVASGVVAAISAPGPANNRRGETGTLVQVRQSESALRRWLSWRPLGSWTCAAHAGRQRLYNRFGLSGLMCVTLLSCFELNDWALGNEGNLSPQVWSRASGAPCPTTVSPNREVVILLWFRFVFIGEKAKR